MQLYFKIRLYNKIMNKENTRNLQKKCLKQQQPDYKKTLRACYLGFITQAICANFAPLLFLTFHKNYQIPLGFIALIPVTFFFTQLVVDIFCAKFVDRIGYRASIISPKNGQKIPKITNLQYNKGRANYGTKKKSIYG